MRLPYTIVLLLGLQLGAAGPLRGQAWLAPKGETTVALTMQANRFLGHLEDSGSRLEVGDSYSRVALLEVDHSLSDRFAITIGIPYVATKNGDDPSPVAGRSGVDDGRWHATWQDWRLAARYQFLADPVALTPFLRIVVPSHRYETRAEAAPGRDLGEMIVGINAGRLLEIVPGSFAHARVSYAIVEKLAGISTNRMNADLTLGYVATPSLTVSVSGGIQDTHGGLTDVYVFGPDVTDEEFLEHDRVLADDHFAAAVGVSYSLGRKWSVSGGYSKVLSGSNSHYGSSITLGVQWRRVPPE